MAFALATANGLLADGDADQTSSDPADQVSPEGPDADAPASV